MPFNKPDIRQLSAVGSTVGDVYFPQTLLSLPFDGANGATTTSDLSNHNHTVTFNGDAQISTAQSKFGSSSLYLDGSGDYVEINSVASKLSAASAFTIEGWFKLPDSSDVGILWAINSSSGGNVLWGIVNADSTINFNAGGSSSNISISPVNIRDGNWHHVAVTFDGTDYDLYVDGNRYHQNFTQSTALSSNDKIQIGMEYDTSSKTDYLKLYCNDFRISAFRRYTDSTYTVPTAVFSTSAGDVNKHIVVNSTADGVAIGTGGINQARIAKAWVNFDGTGTIAIRESYNVSSLTDHATGDYTVTFSTAMTDANYVMAGSALHSTWSYSGDNSHRLPMPQKDGYLASSIRVFTKYGHHTGSGQEDENIVNVIIFGN
jgi:hypothetical protein